MISVDPLEFFYLQTSVRVALFVEKDAFFCPLYVLGLFVKNQVFIGCLSLFLGIQYDSIEQSVCYQSHVVFITIAL